MTKTYDSLPLIVRVLLQLIFGWVISIFYRVFKFLDSKDTGTILGIVLSIFPLMWFVDLVTTIFQGKITVLAK